jgi:hypothetical protein
MWLKAKHPEHTPTVTAERQYTCRTATYTNNTACLSEAEGKAQTNTNIDTN